MPFSFSGMEVPDVNRGGVWLQAKDANTNAAIRVFTSREAMDDHGLARVRDVASEKYDRGRLEVDGSVFVRTGDS